MSSERTPDMRPLVDQILDALEVALAGLSLPEGGGSTSKGRLRADVRAMLRGIPESALLLQVATNLPALVGLESGRPRLSDVERTTVERLATDRTVRIAEQLARHFDSPGQALRIVQGAREARRTSEQRTPDPEAST